MAASFRELLSDAKKEIREVSVEDVKRLLDARASVKLIDVREGDEYAGGRLPGALHIPRGFLELRIEDKAGHDEELVLYCAGGIRSALAARTLQSMGYTRVASLAGGYNRWSDAALPGGEAGGAHPRAEGALPPPPHPPRGGRGGAGEAAHGQGAAAGRGRAGLAGRALPRRRGRGHARHRRRGRGGPEQPPAPGPPHPRARRPAQGGERPRRHRGPQPRREGGALRRAPHLRQRPAHPRGLRPGPRRRGQLPHPLPAQRRVRDAGQAQHPRLHLPLRGPGHDLRPGPGPLLPLPLPRPAAARARPLVRRGRRARRAARHHRPASRPTRPSSCSSAWASRSWGACSPSTRSAPASRSSSCGGIPSAPCARPGARVELIDYEQFCSSPA